jgi:hypothetical protein
VILRTGDELELSDAWVQGDVALIPANVPPLG